MAYPAITNYEWKIDGATVASGAGDSSYEYTPTTAGRKTVTLIKTNADGDTETFTRIFNVHIDRDTVKVWNFGVGNLPPTTSPSIETSFSPAGTRIITLTVSDTLESATRTRIYYVWRHFTVTYWEWALQGTHYYSTQIQGEFLFPGNYHLYLTKIDQDNAQETWSRLYHVHPNYAAYAIWSTGDTGASMQYAPQSPGVYTIVLYDIIGVVLDTFQITYTYGWGISSVYDIGSDRYYDKKQPAHGDLLANIIEVPVSPLVEQGGGASAVEVYRSDSSITLGAGGSTTVIAKYSGNPVPSSGRSAELEVESGDMSIDSITYYAWGAVANLTSTSGGTAVLTIDGKPLLSQGAQVSTAEDSSSIQEFGRLKYEFPENHLVQSKTLGDQIAASLLASYKMLRKDIELDWIGHPAVVLGDLVRVPEYQKNGLNVLGQFYVTKQELVYDGTLRAQLYGRKATLS